MNAIFPPHHPLTPEQRAGLVRMRRLIKAMRVEENADGSVLVSHDGPFTLDPATMAEESIREHKAAIAADAERQKR